MYAAIMTPKSIFNVDSFGHLAHTDALGYANPFIGDESARTRHALLRHRRKFT
jgi:hypothetical protein